MAEIRALQLKQDLQALVALGSDSASLIIADLPARDLRQIEQAAPFDWLPIAIDLELCRAVHAAAGDEGSRAWGRATVRLGIEHSMLKPVFEASVRLFGLTPMALLRLAPLVWRSTFREAGRFQVTMVPGQAASLRLIDLPEVMRVRPFLLTVAGCCEAVFDMVHGTGAIELVDPAGGEPRFIATWPGK